MAAMTTPSRPVVLVSTASTSRDRGLRRQDAVTGRNYSQALLAEGALPLMAANLDPAAAHDSVLAARAAEGTEGGWLLAVQWHPEMSYASYPAGRWPFRAFVQALVPAPEPARAPGGAAPASW
jgi:hypothetical protein